MYCGDSTQLDDHTTSEPDEVISEDDIDVGDADYFDDDDDHNIPLSRLQAALGKAES